MITFFRRALPLLSPWARRRFFIASFFMLILAMLKAAAIVALLPLMSILTSVGLKSSSRLVGDLSRFVGNPKPTQLALALGLATIVLYIVKAALAILTFRWAMRFSLEEEASLVRRLMNLYLHAPYREHLKTNSSEHVRTLTVAIRALFQQGFVAGFGAVGDMFSVVFVGIILLAANPVLALAAAAYFGVVVFIYQRVINRVMARRAEKLHHDQAIDFRTITQSLTTVKEIQVRGVEDNYTEEVFRLRKGLVPTYRSMALVTMTPRYVLETAIVGAAGTIAGVAYSTESIGAATATVGLFLVGGFRMLAPLNKIVFGNAQAKASIPALNQVLSDLEDLKVSGLEDQPAPVAELAPAPLVGAIAAAPAANGHGSLIPPPAPDLLDGGADADRPARIGRPGPTDIEPRITLSGVWFSYVPGVPVLQDVTVEIAPGESIGLVGESGAGKSTLLDVLLGLLEPDEGTITIGGYPLATVRRQWQRMIGYVPQAIAVFDESVRSNVMFGLPPTEIDDADVWRALRLAQLDELVRDLPDGLDSMVGEAGTRLSGGQRQRLGVARALVRRPSVLMFDEATSALDNETEFKLTEVLESLAGQVTTVTIAHRLSTVRRCDRVLFLEDGRLAAQGPFNELSERIPGFARLVELSSLNA